jgi:hypothetical protein
MLERFHNLATKWQTYVILFLGIPLFMLLIGNIGGKNGNPSWLLGPVCLLLIIAFGIDAGVQAIRRD